MLHSAGPTKDSGKDVTSNMTAISCCVYTRKGRFQVTVTFPLYWWWHFSSLVLFFSFTNDDKTSFLFCVQVNTFQGRSKTNQQVSENHRVLCSSCPTSSREVFLCGSLRLPLDSAFFLLPELCSSEFSYLIRLLMYLTLRLAPLLDEWLLNIFSFQNGKIKESFPMVCMVFSVSTLADWDCESNWLKNNQVGSTAWL